ncbi:MAG TPA: hypothetical protein IAB44_14575 [Candidatus Limivivens intestinipullorum]|uniref:Zn-finger containing protein n=1 Tax=Candidatus Limivivens intestinipullorum TaxID=2840858 RepID=A0A9D1JLU8_9FIRM|nr:hypothetical protein [Candidatus Limivivens intestinipullorum]
MKEKFQRFMTGRYGVDDLSKFLLGVAVVLCVLSLFLRSGLLNALVFLALIVLYFRIFSRNFSARSHENSVFLKYKNRVTGFWTGQINLLKQRKDYHIYTCPQCKQKIRIPRGKGKIEITCPKCRNKFIKKS